MQRPILVLLFFLFNSLAVFSQSTGYPVSLINDSIKLGANAVVREEILEFTYLSAQKTISKYRIVITVLNKNGDESAEFAVIYDKFRSIESIKGNIYDASGKLIRKIKASEISDVSGSAGYPEFADIRYKTFEPLISVYPYTVEIEYEVSMAGSYLFPEWMAFNGYNVSLEKSLFRIIVPKEYKFFYKTFNIDTDHQFLLSEDNENKTYTWKAENLIAIDQEPFSEDKVNYMPSVYTSPSFFSLGGYEGKMDTWNSIGKWQQQVNNGRDILAAGRINEIKAMVSDIQDDREKVRKLYKYLQSRTRYFSVQLGFGGLQPIDAKIVDEVGYGDCKGLSNYMKALLKAVGIESYYTWVTAGEDFPQIIPDFVYDPFNHIILCVPLKNDTIWLECTNQVLPFDFLGDFTSDRHVLLIKENGGELVKTPVYSMDDNFQHTHASVILTGEGNGTAEISRTFGGLQYDDKLGYLNSSKEEQKEWLYYYYPIPNLQLKAFEFRKDPADKPESTLKSSANLSNYASSSGKRLFLPLNLTNRSSYIPPKTKNRRSAISLVTSFIDADTVEYVLPDGMDVEFLPEPRNIKSAFGEYVSRVTLNDNKIVYFRELKMFKGTYTKDKYEELIKFYSDISVADKCQAILIKKES